MRGCRNRTTPLLSVIVIAIAATGGCSAPPAAPGVARDTIVTKRLDLVDDAGVVRARLGIDADGSAGVFLLDAQGRNRAALIDDESQTALYLFDGEGTIRIGVAQFAHGGGGVALHGEESKGAAVLYLENGEGSVTFYDDAGAIVHRVPERSAAD